MRSSTLLFALLVIFVSAAAAPARAAEYVVGAAETPTLASVPWASLGADDIVTIPWREAPYAETFAVTTSGTEGHPITVRGTRGPLGQRPVLDGENAVAGPGSHPRSLASIRGGASYVVVEGLELRHAHPDHAHAGLFTSNASSGIYVEDGAHVVVRDCELHGNGNGFFTAPGTVDVRLERSYLWGNGIVGSSFQHNSYTESDGIVFEENRFGPLCAGCTGTNLKDRSAGTVIRTNWLEGGGRVLDLVEADGQGEDFTNRVASTPVYVYGNVLIKIDDTSQSQVVHFGGDNGDVPTYRRLLYFYGNTVFSTRDVRTTFFHFDANAPVIDVRNSLFVTTTSSQIYLLDSSTSTSASVSIRNCFLPTGWSVSVAPALAAAVSTTGVATGADPGFVDASSLDFHLLANATVRDAGTSLAAGAPVVLRQYVRHQTSEPRPADGPLDLGAFEHCTDGCTPATEPDGGVTPGVDAGTSPGGGGDGCGCRVATRRTSPSALALLALGLVVALRQRARKGASCVEKTSTSTPGE